MPTDNPLAYERLRTIVADAIDKPGMDAPWAEAEPVVERFSDVHFEYRTNEHGVRVRRVAAATAWENDPDADAVHPVRGHIPRRAL